MVKSPKIQHSKPAGEPLTIELPASAVKRVEAAGPADTAKSAEAPKPAEAAKPAAEPRGSTPRVSPSPRVEEPAAKPSAAAATEPKTNTAFGRDAGAKPATPPAPPPRTDAPKPAAARPEPQRRTGSALAGGIIGGAIALAAAGGAWYGGLLDRPAPAVVQDNAPVDALRAEIDALKTEIQEIRNAPPQAAAAPDLTDINARIEGFGVLVDELRADLTRIEESLANGSAGGGDATAVAALREQLAALEQRVAAMPAGGDADLAAIRTELGAATESARQATEAAAAATASASEMAGRMGALEQSLAALSAKVDEAAAKPGVALAIAASALKSAIDRGLPFTAELDTYAGLAPDTPEIAGLRGFAATGVPTREDIASGVDAAAVAMIDAVKVDNPSAGFLERLWASAQSIVKVRPIGDIAGEGVDAGVARMEQALVRGDYERALAEYEKLPEAAKAAGAPLVEKVRARQTADALIGKVLAAALRA